MGIKLLKIYASYFSSYLLRELNDTSNIRQIILFGSAARDEAVKDSDVDIFIEINKKNRKLEEKIKKITDSFYRSREALLFKTKGVDNKINIIAGKLDDWIKLKDSIESTGVVLYGPYISSGVEGRKYIIISWDKVKFNRGAFLNKVYGFSVKGKRYSGLLEGLKGRKLGKSTIMVPVESREEILKLAKKYGADARILEVWA